MKRLIVFVLLSLCLWLSACTGLESLLIGGIVGGLQNAYLKPLVDKYATVTPAPAPTGQPAVAPVPAKP